MIFGRSLARSNVRAVLFSQASQVLGSGPSKPFHALSGPIKNSKFVSPSTPQNLGTRFGLLSFKNFIHSGKQAEFEAGRTFTPLGSNFQRPLRENRNNNEDMYAKRPLFERRSPDSGRAPPPSMDFVQGLLQENGNDSYFRRPFQEPRQMEANADIVHMKLMRNNCFITVTDSKGNKKAGTSAGKLAGKAGKIGKYSAEAAAEDMGRKVRQMKTKSVVVKVNGFTFFKKKKLAILSFKDGYTNSRGNMNPVVFIEDTTRKPHNGCRLKKNVRK